MYIVFYNITLPPLKPCPPAGDPIDCIVDPDVPQNVMDTYCWIHSTFSIPNRYNAIVS